MRERFFFLIETFQGCITKNIQHKTKLLVSDFRPKTLIKYNACLYYQKVIMDVFSWYYNSTFKNENVKTVKPVFELATSF